MKPTYVSLDGRGINFYTILVSKVIWVIHFARKKVLVDHSARKRPMDMPSTITETQSTPSLGTGGLTKKKPLKP